MTSPTYSTPQQSARMAAFPRFPRPLSPIARVDRYLAIVARTRRLLTHNGSLPVSHGGKPLPYARIESLAWNRYCRNNPEVS